MIFSNPDNGDKFKAVLVKVFKTKKGNLRLKIVDPKTPNLEPGFLTFNEGEVKAILKILKE